MQSRRVTVRGIPIRWEEQGDGFPVVLVHGIPTSPRLWRHVAPRLSGMRVLAFEMVGYGESIVTGEDREIGVARQAAYLAKWLREVGVERAVLVGHDLGGGVAQILAVRHPNLAAGLVLVDSIAYDSWPIPAMRALRAAAPVVERLPLRAVRPLFEGLLRRGHDSDKVAAESIDAHWEAYERYGRTKGLTHQARSLVARDTQEIQAALPGLRLPARIVWGADDPFQEIRYAERLAWDLDADLHAVPGGRHFVPEDQPEVVAQAIDAVVQEAEAKRPLPRTRTEMP